MSELFYASLFADMVFSLFQKYDIKPTPSEMPLKDKNPSVGNTDQLVNGIDTEMEIMIQKPDEKEKGDVKFV